MVTTLATEPGFALDSADFGMGDHTGSPALLPVEQSLIIVGSGPEGDLANLLLTCRDLSGQVTGTVEFELSATLSQPEFQESFDPGEDHVEVFCAPVQAIGNAYFRDPATGEMIIATATEVQNSFMLQTTASYSAATGLTSYSYHVTGVEDAVAQAFSQGPETVTLGTGSDYFCDPDGAISLYGGNGNDTLACEGSGADSVIAGNGNDEVTVHGTGHSINLGAGDDRLTWANDGQSVGALASSINGGSGRDTIHGTNGMDSFIESPGSGNDSIYGGVGVDTVIYASSTAAIVIDLGLGSSSIAATGEADLLAGIESARGTAFGDELTGAANNNLLQGLAGNDTLSGLGGVDTLHGGDGNDQIIGGLRADSLTGGTGNDCFVFLALDESRAGAGFGVDVISDFGQTAGNDDMIDLSALDANATLGGDQAFVLTGNGGKAAFTGAGGELRWTSSAAKTNVMVDIDGNLVADFQISLTGSLTLTASDFVL